MNDIILTKVIKVGNSCAVVIPRDIRVALDIQRGDQVSFGVYSEDVICIRKISQRELQNLKPQNYGSSTQ